MSGKQTLQDELEAEFAKHDPAADMFGYSCTCGWLGESVPAHLAEIATRITNARVEGLIRDAAEAGFKLRKTWGEPEYGVAYPIFKDGKPERIMVFTGKDTKEQAEEFINSWSMRGQQTQLLSRQWRSVL